MRCTYPKIVSLSRLIACNAMNRPGGVALSLMLLYLDFTIDLCCAPLVSTP